MSSRDRTVYWVQSHSEQAEFHSPSVPPSELDYSSPPSDTGSSHSVPPKMVLRYDDGRPDMPISRSDRKHHRTRGRRHVEFDLSPQYANPPVVEVRSRAYRDRVVPNAPEEIRILPSSAHREQPRSRSLPRARHESLAQPRPKHSHGHSSSHSKSRHAHPGAVVHSPPQPQNYGMYKTVNGYPNVTSNGVIYSHSPPVIVRHGHPGAAAFPEHRLVVPVNPPHVRHPRSRSISLHGPRPVVIDRSDVSSSDSEDEAYYGSRRRRDKKSASTTSHDKSSSSSSGPPTPGSRTPEKRPFFQRLFSFTGKPSPEPPRVSIVADESDGHRRRLISSRR